MTITIPRKNKGIGHFIVVNHMNPPVRSLDGRLRDQSLENTVYATRERVVIRKDECAVLCQDLPILLFSHFQLIGMGDDVEAPATGLLFNQVSAGSAGQNGVYWPPLFQDCRRTKSLSQLSSQ